MTHPPHLPPIGIVGLPDLAQYCVKLGLPVLTDDSPEGAAVAIADHVDHYGPLPILASDTVLDRARPWLGALAETTPIVVATHDGATVLPAEPMRAILVPLPASAATLLAAAGLTGLPPEADSRVIAGAHVAAARDEVQEPIAAPTALPSLPDEAPEPPARPADPAASAIHRAATADEPTEQPTVQPAAYAPDRFRKCVICWSAKGGVGKSTFSIALAEAAAANGLRVALIDANFGQGDIRTYLRIGTSGLPSIYQAVDGAVEAAFVAPDDLNVTRPIKLEPVKFTVVQAPPPHMAGDPAVTPELYMRAVEYAVDHYDLVVLDTQILEAVDRTGMVDRFLHALLLGGANGLGISDASGAGIANALTRLKTFETLGIPTTHQLALLNRVPVHGEVDVVGVAEVFAEHATYAGTVYSDDAIPAATNRGRPVAHLDQLHGPLGVILAQATGAPQPAAHPAVPSHRAADTDAASHPANTPTPTTDPGPRPTRPARRGFFRRS